MQLLRMAGLGLALTALAAALAAVPAQAQTIDTLSQQNGIQYDLGNPDTATYGQTITATASDAVLQDFSFNVRNDGAGNLSSTSPVNVDADVYAWNGTQATGSALYQSPTFTIAPSHTYALYTATTGGLSLTSGSRYVIFFTTSGHEAGESTSYAGLGTTSPQAYTGGEFVFLNSGNDRSQLTSSPWTSSYGEDLAFKADFETASAPEPSQVGTLALMGLGLGGLLVRARRRSNFSA